MFFPFHHQPSFPTTTISPSHHQQPCSSPLPTMLITTTALCDCPRTPMTTNDCSTTMTSQKMKMATHKWQPTPTPQTTAWTHEQTWAVTSPGESMHPSLPFISFIRNTGATSQLVTWQPNDEWRHCQCCHSLLLLISDATVSIPCPTFVPIHLTETQDTDNLAQWRNMDMGWRRGHKMRMWPRQEAMRTCNKDRTTMTHGDDDTRWWWYMVTRQQQHFPFHITPTPLPLTSPSL